MGRARRRPSGAHLRGGNGCGPHTASSIGHPPATGRPTAARELWPPPPNHGRRPRTMAAARGCRICSIGLTAGEPMPRFRHPAEPHLQTRRLQQFLGIVLDKPTSSNSFRTAFRTNPRVATVFSPKTSPKVLQTAGLLKRKSEKCGKQRVCCYRAPRECGNQRVCLSRTVRMSDLQHPFAPRGTVAAFPTSACNFRPRRPTLARTPCSCYGTQV